MDDYSRIAKVIRYLDAHHGEEPSLSELAAVVKLSESQFHRLFRNWAGVTPKDFLQCLTTEYAQKQLRNSETVFDAALDSGLSGPDRVHDLTTTLVAATPGEIRSSGTLTIQHGVGETPFGWATVAWTDRGICHLAFHEDNPGTETPESLLSDWSHAKFRRAAAKAHSWLDRIFSENRSSAGLTAFVRGTPFQVLVWRALLQIPEGSLTSYSKLADAVGRSGASRAIGTACGKNPIGYLIPCHRVIRETGAVTGYRWGTERKRIILGREALTHS